MTSPLDRAKQLIAKAVNPATSEEEARTTALIAARLIAQHKMLEALEEVGPEPEPPWPGPPPPHHSPGAPPVGFEAFWEMFVDVIGRPGAPFPGPAPGRRRPGPPPARDPWRPVEPTYPGARSRPHAGRPIREEDGPWWHRLPCELVMFADRNCEVCGKPCAQGETVWAYELVRSVPSGGTWPRVAHLKDCRDKLPPQHRHHR